MKYVEGSYFKIHFDFFLGLGSCFPMNVVYIFRFSEGKTDRLLKS
jgi:hypothetical protein